MRFPTKLSSGAQTTDIPCPSDGELVNVRCWYCGWRRDSEERSDTIRQAGGYTFMSSDGLPSGTHLT
jgi:DNA-directed RNA polymerase subunit RPC12/RpoP